MPDLASDSEEFVAAEWIGVGQKWHLDLPHPVTEAHQNALQASTASLERSGIFRGFLRFFRGRTHNPYVWAKFEMPDP